jgi:hypothetical protein
MTTRRASTNRVFLMGILFTLVAGVSAARAAEPVDEAVAESQRARNGAGLQLSSWQPDKPAGFQNDQTVAFHGYFQKGLDQHLAWENTLGYWRRTSTWTETQPILGTTTHELQTHLVPAVTALRLYPLTTSTSPIDPYVSAGVGPVLGFQQQKASGNLAPADANTIHTGLATRAGVGVDIRASEAFGLAVGAHFQSASFGEDMAGERLYRGWGADLGLVYRFQYR